MSTDIFAANPGGVTDILNRSTVFIAGAGGLGSNVASILVRAGVRRLLIADFDHVCHSNLNRQQFFQHQIGALKVEALRENLLAINPDAEITVFPVRLEAANFAAYLPEGVDVVFECFDNPAAKAALTRFVLSERPDVPLVAVSGLAGVGDPGTLKVSRRGSKFYLVGDGISDADEQGTLASRVIAAAAIQAHCGIQIILDAAGWSD